MQPNQYTSGKLQKKPLSEIKSWTWLRKRILKERGRKCELCGWDKRNPVTELSPVDIHHKDGNRANTYENNLIVLCPNCHSLTPNYKHCRKHTEEVKRRFRQPKPLPRSN